LSWSRILSLASLCLLQDRLPYEGTLNPATVLPRLDVTCILRTWRVKGVLACPWNGHMKPCLWVENAYPCGLLEVVRQPFKSHLAGFPGSRRSTAGHNETQLQYAETRVFSYVPPFVQDLEIPIAAPRGPTFMVNYVSELDAPGWRTGLLEALFRSPEKVGAWGCASPRTGWVDQPSEPLAAHLQAIRAGKVAALPIGRVVISPYAFEPRVGHYVQMVSPVVRSCVTIGNSDLRALETGAGSPYGAYLFVHWGLFDECRRCLRPRLLPPRSP
jgi:hypothetical protein